MKIEALEMFRDKKSVECQNKYNSMNRGQKNVVDAYLCADKDILVDELVIDTAWSSDMQDILDFLKELKINRFVFSITSTECFQCILVLIANNCKLSNINYKKELLFGALESIKKGILVEF